MKEQGWLRMEKIDADYKLDDELEKSRLSFLRCANRHVPSIDHLLFELSDSFLSLSLPSLMVYLPFQWPAGIHLNFDLQL